MSKNKCVTALKVILADTYVLYLKTQNFHWNVKNPNFYMLHLMFESQYSELSEAVDILAERIRALDERTPASFEEFQALATLKSKSGATSADQMIAELLADHQKLIKELHSAISLSADEDPGTADLFTQRIQHHEKVAWILKSSKAN